MMTFFSPFIETFINFRVSMGFSRKTYDCLGDFDRFVQQKYPDEIILDKKIVMEWIQLKNNEKFTGQRVRMTKIRLFAQYLLSKNIDAYVLSAKFASLKIDFIPYIFTDEELEKLFKTANCITPHRLNPFRHEQLPVMLQLTFCCGLRPGECRLLKTNDVDLHNGVLLIRQNKLHNERYVPMSLSVADMCIKYKSKLQLYSPDSEYFFPNPHGIPYTSDWFKNNFKYLLKKAFPKSNVKARVYDLRHRFATTVLMNWLNEGNDINAMLPYLCIYMGHSNLNSTAYYIHLLPDNLVKSSAIDWNHFNSLIPKVIK